MEAAPLEAGPEAPGRLGRVLGAPARVARGRGPRTPGPPPRRGEPGAPSRLRPAPPEARPPRGRQARARSAPGLSGPARGGRRAPRPFQGQRVVRRRPRGEGAGTWARFLRAPLRDRASRPPGRLQCSRRPRASPDEPGDSGPASSPCPPGTSVSPTPGNAQAPRLPAPGADAPTLKRLEEPVITRWKNRKRFIAE